VGFPDFEELMRPLLLFLEDGRLQPGEAIRSELASRFSITPSQRAEVLENGISRWANLVAWALHHLSRARLVERPKKSRSEYRITHRGREVLASGEDINVRLCMRFPEWHRSKRERQLAEQRMRAGFRIGASHDNQPGASERRTDQALDPLDRLAKLADLKDRGALTTEEFEAQKAKILRAD
jgi:restriction endonuclease Mrr